MNPPPKLDTILDLLRRVEGGELTANAAVGELVGVPTDDAVVDVDRARRCGFSEVVYGEGKSSRSIIQIFEVLAHRRQHCFATRVSPDQAEAVLTRWPDAVHNPTARTIRRMVETGTSTSPAGVCVVGAGTTDRAVAEEAVETLRWMGVPVQLILDVGVAGPDRIQPHVARFRQAAAVVVVAGMEGALPSVVGGHTACPVIAVPTSVGYGASLGGFAALLSMLNSCAANVTVVNIDAGFKGGYVAGLIAHAARAT